MLKPTMQRLLATAMQLLRQPRTLLVFAAMYAALLATLYSFAVVREATLAQVLLTLFLILAAPLEFLTLQAAIIDNASNGCINWRRVVRKALKLAAVTLPVIIVGAGLLLLLSQLQSQFPAPPAPSRQTLHWPTLLFSTLRWLLFGIALPLFTIHLWIFRSEISNLRSKDSPDELFQTRRPIGPGERLSMLQIASKALPCAFTPGAVFTYTVGLVLFAMIPYAILFVQLPLRGGRIDFAVLIIRGLLVFVTTLFGWTLTLTSLAHDAAEFEAHIMDKGDAVVGFELQAQRL